MQKRNKKYTSISIDAALMDKLNLDARQYKVPRSTIINNILSNHYLVQSLFNASEGLTINEED